MKNSLFRTVTLLILLFMAIPAHANLFKFEFNSTLISNPANPLPTGLAVGQSAKITVALDNGGASNISQTWSAANLQSVTFDFNNGAVLTTFTYPFWLGVQTAAQVPNSFITNALGNLTSVLTYWGSNGSVGVDFTTNDATAPFAWILNGGNGVYYTGVNQVASIANVGLLLSPAAWTPVVTPVPEPAAIWLILIGLAVLSFSRTWRKHFLSISSRSYGI